MPGALVGPKSKHLWNCRSYLKHWDSREDLSRRVPVAAGTSLDGARFVEVRKEPRVATGLARVGATTGGRLRWCWRVTEVVAVGVRAEEKLGPQDVVRMVSCGGSVRMPGIGS